jgi:hypothetical protein
MLEGMPNHEDRMHTNKLHAIIQAKEEQMSVNVRRRRKGIALYDDLNCRSSALGS